MHKTLKAALAVVGGVLLAQCANQNVTAQPQSTAGLNSIYFDYDQALIRSDAAATIQGNAAYMKAHSGSYVIEGNCDNRGTNEYNLALGQRRAEAGRSYLANLGVTTNVLTVSYGEEKPVCFENDESCWQRNRRDDFRKK